MINTFALFSDETIAFKTPYEPKAGDTVTIRIRTLLNDVLRAYAVVNGVRHSMIKYKTERYFDYYEYSFVCPEKAVSYHFVVYDDDDKICYNRLGYAENNQTFLKELSILRGQWSRLPSTMAR